jgi:hypothetical protein
MRIDIKDLRDGDVLLFHGTALLSKIIMRLDGGNYSHAGVIRDGQVTEALGDGINHRAVAASVAGAKFVDIFRFRKNGGGLGDPPYPVQALDDAIQAFEIAKNKYAYDELFLLALLCSTRRLTAIMKIPGMAMFVRDFLDSAMERLSSLMASGTKPVICSEMVFRCFENAVPQGTYTLLIKGADIPSAQAVQSVIAENPEAAEIQAHAAAFLQSYSQAVLGPAAPLAPAPIIAYAAPVSAYSAAITAFAVANFVTPRDLQDSPNLQLAGTLSY